MAVKNDRWAQFIGSLPAESRLSSVLLHDWRPRLSEAEEGQLALRSVSPEALQARLERNRDLLTATIPHLGWLTTVMSGIPHVVFLTDADGIVLHSSGNDSPRMAAFGLFPGYDWSEDAIGPNGAGTALVHNRPVAVVGPEHCAMALEDCTCTGAPVHAPDGALIGAIAINTGVQNGTPERLIMVAHTAHIISQEILRGRERRVDRLNGLQHTTIRLLAESASFEGASARVLQSVCEALSMKWGAIWKLDRQVNSLRLAEIWHLPDERYQEFDRVSRGQAVTAGVGLAGRAWAVSGAAWSLSLAADLPNDRAAAAIGSGLSGGFAFPIRNGMVVLGVMEFFDGDSIAPDAELITGLDTIGSQFGLFLQRRDAEAALRESERRYSTLAETVPGVLFSAMAGGEWDYASHHWYDYTGMATGTAEGWGWLDAIHPDDREAVKRAWSEGIDGGGTFDSQHRLRKRDGTYRWFAARAIPVRSEQGSVISWYGTSLDIDQQKRAQEALQEADRRKDEFLAMLAHELRNPLAPIRNAMHLIRAQPENAELTEKAQTMAERQLEHMTRLIDDLLDVSRISRGRIRLQLEPLDLKEVISSAAESSRASLAARQQDFRIELPAESIPFTGDRTRLEQIVTNLLDNASKFTRAGGRIELAVTCERGVVSMMVRDDGIGIDPASLPHVFELFYQEPGALEGARGGLGIGLTMVQRLTQLHGGTVEARSRGSGQGSEFVVRLPRSSRNVGETAAAAGALRVLIVDDNRDAAETTAMMLRLWDYEVATAGDGDTALQLAATFLPDVILLDLGLPVMPGHEVARRLRALTGLESVFIIAVTGYNSSDDRRRTRDAGVDCHFAKPVDPKLLQTTLAEHAAHIGKAEPKRPE